MPTPDVLHIVTRPPTTADRVAIQRLAAESGGTHALLDLGQARWLAPDLATHRHPAVAPLRLLRQRRVSEYLRRHPPSPSNPLVAHCWDAPAAAAVARLAGNPFAGLVLEHAATAYDALVWQLSVPQNGLQRCRWIIRTAATAEHLRRRGVATRAYRQIPALVDERSLAAATANRYPARGQLPRQDILVLPPIERPTHAYYAVWAGLLLNQIDTRVRTLVPAGGREADRVARLVQACRLGRAVHFLPPDMSLAKAFRTARVAVWLGDETADPAAVRWAAAARTPLLVSTATRVRDTLGTLDRIPTVATPRDPQAIAAALHRLLTDPGRAAAAAAAALRAYEALGDEQASLRAYRATYTSLIEQDAAGQ